MSDVFEIQTPAEPDVRFYEAFKAIGSEHGYQVECVGDTIDGQTIYHALIMTRTEYDTLLAEVNEKERRDFESITLMPGERREPFRPHEVLPWEFFIEQEGLVSGYPTRKSALLASLKKVFYPN
ncbi:MAG TPA: hypothetical protein VMR34_02430 [Candidatus Saccharimonadales bacterium]|nr:hypothetical protein [Candidatus Saccharimonadales bacterium]